ncbi:hypothetical protein [Thaumasiovibrio subtropicus]|uniref:hypothetical protein n=1 Tax=Thaumasiovibrio subtropicus TaxID=1891207 RepID=UPI000B352CD5|nr:hypothetical protein [Thaumasiovibrio subtropicus]
MKIKTLTLFVGAALLAGCNSSSTSESPAPVVNNTLTVKTVMTSTTEDVNGHNKRNFECAISDFEVLVHDENGDYAKTLTTDSNGEISFKDVPAHHYVTLNPSQAHYKLAANETIYSFQKEIVTANAALYIDDYKGTSLEHCVEMIDEPEIEQLRYIDIAFALPNLPGLHTIPELDEAGRLELTNDLPGVMVYTTVSTDRYDEPRQAAFVSIDELRDKEFFKFDADRLQDVDGVTLNSEALANWDSASYRVDGYTYFSNANTAIEDTQSPLQTLIPFPQIEGGMGQFDVASSEHQDHNMNVFSFGSTLFSNERNVTVPNRSIDTFYVRNNSPQVFEFELNDFNADLVELFVTYASGEEVTLSHVVLGSGYNSTIATPVVRPTPEIADQYIGKSLFIANFEQNGKYAAFFDGELDLNLETVSDNVVDSVEALQTTDRHYIWTGNLPH